MVIQRIQTLFLLIATILLSVFVFIPFGYWNVTETSLDLSLTPLEASAQPGLLVPVCVAAILAFLAIFLYKKVALQKLCVILSVVSSLVSIAMITYLLTTGYVDTDTNITITTQWGWGVLLIVLAIISDIAAYRNISKDQKLLRSYDRLR